MRYEYDLIVVGGGHAGCEAASAAARMGTRTLLITMDISKLAEMSCNPAVGGVAKGQIVREIDALGGMMGIIADRTTLQFRILNRSKGAAMWSPRAQCDKSLFTRLWRQTLENTEKLYLWQDTVTKLVIDANGPKPRVTGVITQLGAEFRSKAVILTAGTFLDGRLFVGRNSAPGGRAGDSASYGITEQLISLGFEAGRMKTGTPARIDARTINFEAFQIQEGDEDPSKFSFSTQTEPVKNQLPCFILNTSDEVHDILRQSFSESPLFSGEIKGLGPRYCPSIEDKLNIFSDKDSHQLFLEPEGRETNEYYLNGFSSSLPLKTQTQALQKIRGLENVHIYRPGYAIEYDFFPPTQLRHTLETKMVDNLWLAGQINGTTGYEEAAAQGLMAAVNAHRKLHEQSEIVLSRDEAYIGVLIDDLVTKGVDEPYRMFTSRAEYRILLRQDNADLRLTPLGHEIGLIDNKRFIEFERKRDNVERIIHFLRKTSISAEEINPFFLDKKSAPITQSKKAQEILLRNEVNISELMARSATISKFISQEKFTKEEIEEAEIKIKYKGYVERERHLAEKMKRLEDIKIYPDFDFGKLTSLTIEARQKLTKIKPATIGQAARIPGVSPADINVLLIYFGR